MLTREAIVESEKIFAIEKVPLPAWAQICDVKPEECYLYARTLGADRADDVERITAKQQARETAGEEGRKALAFAEWAVLGTCDQDGNLFFTEEDIPELLKRPMMPLVELAGAVMLLNGVTKAEPAKKEGAASSDAPKEG